MFGRDMIRWFSMNVSEMKRLAAYDFEDLLQVCNSSVATCRIPTDLSSAVRSPSV